MPLWSARKKIPEFGRQSSLRSHRATVDKAGRTAYSSDVRRPCGCCKMSSVNSHWGYLGNQNNHVAFLNARTVRMKDPIGWSQGTTGIPPSYRLIWADPIDQIHSNWPELLSVGHSPPAYPAGPPVSPMGEVCVLWHKVGRGKDALADATLEIFRVGRGHVVVHRWLILTFEVAPETRTMIKSGKNPCVRYQWRCVIFRVVQKLQKGAF